jgi:hypothetical protein
MGRHMLGEKELLLQIDHIFDNSGSNSSIIVAANLDLKIMYFDLLDICSKYVIYYNEKNTEPFKEVVKTSIREIISQVVLFYTGKATDTLTLSFPKFKVENYKIKEYTTGIDKPIVTNEEQKSDYPLLYSVSKLDIKLRNIITNINSKVTKDNASFIKNTFKFAEYALSNLASKDEQRKEAIDILSNLATRLKIA